MSSFAELHRPGEPLVLPNAWDVASGAALVAAGFVAVGTTSLGVAAAAGKRDAAGGAWPETLALARGLVGRGAHVTVDLEHGFSEDAGEVAEHAHELAALGVAGINLEDRYQDQEQHAALVARVKERAPALFLNARTDTHWLGPGDLGEAVERCRRYAAAGADGVFVPGVKAPRDIEVLAGTSRLNVLFLPGTLTVPELANLGVARISTGSLLYRAALGAALATAGAVREGDRLSDLEAPSYQAIDALADCPPADNR
ncbi:MAG TPA: isocitrate lyase/phosphoenolpyruvate mutase family protein [Solirubrobacter sp.]|nr:isocitrate lyase/phosphoenolpyruvate mutase family protein [Solirubrobacter sp.]